MSPELLREFPITPATKPRMTRADKRKPHRPPVGRYFAFQNELRILAGDWLPLEANSWILFTLPMPKSWTKKKRREMDGRAHRQRPDKDNLEKAFLDCFGEDSHIWDGRVTKCWGVEGKIQVFQLAHQLVDESDAAPAEIR